MPDEWPWDCRELGEATSYTDEEGPWTIMTVDELEAYKALHQEAYNLYEASLPPIVPPLTKEEQLQQELEALKLQLQALVSQNG
jgi:hypothetical protein